MKNIFYSFMETQFGPLLISSTEKGVKRIILPSADQLQRLKQDFKDDELSENKKINEKAACQLREYFKGERKQFSLFLDLEATEFQKKVLKAVQKVPYGTTRSYKDIAEKIGNPKAARAVGSANRTNPLPIIIPCHRIIGSDGSLTGYGGGIELKRKLLEFEKRYV
ncbi:MAG: methylated-DNA--[protein]-cysteine S-methyltransferase [bacterium]